MGGNRGGGGVGESKDALKRGAGDHFKTGVCDT